MNLEFKSSATKEQEDNHYADIFKIPTQASLLDTPLLKEEITRRRSARIVYLGISYNFGRPAKKPKDEPLKFDEQI